MVRDDFWMAVTRLMEELEVDLLNSQNMAATDLFDVQHARQVLSSFGRAFGVLPDDPAQLTREQGQFLQEAVNGLAQQGRIICVQLALFAEMMKSSPWTLARLNQVGGVSGIGYRFLEEAFDSRAANPKLRLHQDAGRAILSALLPESGTDIKGKMHSYDDLLVASGYANRPSDFNDVIRILDNETRLITPTDSARRQLEIDVVSPTEGRTKYFQLTHDYLVTPLRDWLTHKQKETRCGRAELLLAERVAHWNPKANHRAICHQCWNTSTYDYSPTHDCGH